MSDSEELRKEPSASDLAQTSVVAAAVSRAARTEASAPPSGLVVFAAVLVLTLLSLGTAIVQLSGATRSDTAAPSAPRTANPAPASVRVASAIGSAEPQSGNSYRVTFAWALDGARDGDAAVVRVFVGGRLVSELRGVLDQTVYSPSSGRLTIAASLDCSTDGWSAELVSVRSQPVVGDGRAKAPGVVCR